MNETFIFNLGGFIREIEQVVSEINDPEEEYSYKDLKHFYEKYMLFINVFRTYSKDVAESIEIKDFFCKNIELIEVKLIELAREEGIKNALTREHHLNFGSDWEC